MYSTPTKNDLDRKLSRMVHEYRAKASTAAAQAVSRMHANGLRTNSAVPGIVTQAVDDLHVEAVGRAIQTVRDFMERMGVPPVQAIAWARPHLQQLADALLFAIPEAGFPDLQRRLQGQYSMNFQTRLDEALEDLKIGFVGDRTVTTREESSEQRALILLKAIYDTTKDTGTPVFTANLGAETGLSTDDLKSAFRYLRDKQLIKTYNIDGTASINAAGIDQIERAQRSSTAPLSAFPAIHQTINIRTAINSQLNQAGHDAVQNVTAAYTNNERADLERLVREFRAHLDELNLAPLEHKRAASQLATIEAQLEDEPDPVIVRQAGKTLRNLTEGVIAGFIATATQPTLWHWIHEASARLFN